MKSPLHRALRVEELARPIRPYALLQCYPNQEYTCLLENPGEGSELGRYSFLATDPFLVFKSKRNACMAGPPGDLRLLGEDPFLELRKLLAHYRGSGSLWSPGLPPFLGGAVGYLSYEMLYLTERIPDLGKDDFAVPDSYLLFCGTVFATDLMKLKSWVITNGFGSSDAEARRRADEAMGRAMERLKAMPPDDADEAERLELRKRRRLRMQSRPRLTEAHLEEMGIRPVVERAHYLRIVEQAREHIFAGDIFEVCTTQRFDTGFDGTGIELYKTLRGVNEAPFSAYLRFPEVEVASSSPERFMRLDRGGWAETRPIKGTRPRGRTQEEDKAYYEDLKTAEKDQAENIMIVDLSRNDLGRVCRFGTVRVPQLRVIESYAFTHQLVSTVRGHLRPEHDAVDLLRAAFPGGSMTGAPKVEAMKIIDRLEPVKRGIFSGSIGYLDFDGSFDLSIVIRTLVKKGDQLTFHVGGAIVADSDPQEEYQETLDKAHGLVTALEFARGGRS